MSNDSAAGPSAVAWRGVRKAYANGHEALRGVSLEVARGELVALLGTSGSGKTTLLKTVNRLIEPTSGEVIVLGKATRDWDPIALRRSIGYVIQDVGLMPHMTILDNVALVCRLRGVERRARQARARECLALVGLEPSRFESLAPHQLSGGQRQRVGVARALAPEPALVLMDEPFGALDPITRRELQEEFDALRRRIETTVILVTHDIREAARLADRVALLDRGNLVQCGTFDELRDHPASDFVRAFLQETTALGSSDPEDRS